jgi:hypothetical protein
MSSSQNKPLPSAALPSLPFIPQKEYNFEHTIVQESPVRAAVALWNLIDFAHVNWVHKKNYAYCKVLAESGRTALIEFGVRYFFFLGIRWGLPVLMWHEHSGSRVQHISRSPWGGYTKVDVRLEEFQKEGKTHTRLTHVYYANLPSFLRPLRKLMERYLESWSAGLWLEDDAMMLRREKVISAGFKDHPLDLVVRAAEGFRE